MLDLILTIILIGSLAGIGVIMAKKLPVLSNLPAVSSEPQASTTPSAVKLWLANRAKNMPLLGNWFKDFSYQMFLQKLLSKIRVMTLKLENKTGNYLAKLREQEKQKIEEAASDNYWNDLKKIIKSKDGLRKKVAAVEKKANAVVEKVSEIKSGVTEEKKKRRRKITMMF